MATIVVWGWLAVFALREENPRSRGAEIPDDRPESTVGPKTEPAILCRACGFVVTTARHRIAVHDSHEHRFMNPAGFLFHIGCFAEAVGCLIAGPASHEYPWFPGFVWRFAMCGGCRGHLGWHFRDQDGAGFFGLVLDRLQERDVV